eukprot:1190788-Prorocentrum_minimum.AAC.5
MEGRVGAFLKGSLFCIPGSVPNVGRVEHFVSCQRFRKRWKCVRWALHLLLLKLLRRHPHDHLHIKDGDPMHTPRSASTGGPFTEESALAACSRFIRQCVHRVLVK